jgi:hypothetical protein
LPDANTGQPDRTPPRTASLPSVPGDRRSSHRLDDELHDLAAVVATGDAILFTGAGFSASALDLQARPLPDAEQMRSELWRLVFGDDESDDSSLQDLYEVALERMPQQLGDYLAQRLSVGDSPLPPYYAAWFSAPWQRVYTLNVDDLEAAVQRQTALPRALVRATQANATATRLPIRADELAVVHLNGLASDGAHAVTFSTFQYAARLCGRDRDYEALAYDITHWPFVFAGTTLDEMVLWQHLEDHHQRAGYHARPPSWLIAPNLSRARQRLLEDLGVRWLPTTIEVVARYLPRCSPSIRRRWR